MLLAATFTILTLRLMFVWFYEPHGFRARTVPARSMHVRRIRNAAIEAGDGTQLSRADIASRLGRSLA